MLKTPLPEPSPEARNHFFYETHPKKPIVLTFSIMSSTHPIYYQRELWHVSFSEWSVQRSTPTLQINLFHKRRGEILKPIHYLLFYTELNHHTNNNYCILFFSDRLSPIRTSLITDLENEANEYHEEWQNMNEILIDLKLFRRELNDIMSQWLEDLSHPLTLDNLLLLLLLLFIIIIMNEKMNSQV